MSGGEVGIKGRKFRPAGIRYDQGQLEKYQLNVIENVCFQKHVGLTC